LHLIVDATVELPILLMVTKASEPDINEAHRLVEQMAQRQPEILQAAETLAANKGYDDTNWDEYQASWRSTFAICGRMRTKRACSEAERK
jgi:hypothetical protein